MVEAISRGEVPPSTMIADAILQLIAHRLRRGALRLAAQIGGGRGNRNLRRLHHGQRNLRLGNAQRDVAGVGGHFQRQPRGRPSR